MRYQPSGILSRSEASNPRSRMCIVTGCFTPPPPPRNWVDILATAPILTEFLSHNSLFARRAAKGCLFEYPPTPSRPVMDCSPCKPSRLLLFSRHQTVGELLPQFHFMASNASYISASQEPAAAVGDAPDQLPPDYSDSA